MNDLLTLVPDYASKLDSRTCIITGVGRSGTTILGKLVGSMSPAVYLFEPLLVRLMPLLVGQASSDQRHLTKFALSILFEDYLAPVLAGRVSNLNPVDDSFFGHYATLEDLQTVWGNAPRRKNLDRYIAESGTKFVVKIPEFQPLFELTRGMIPNCRFLQITRNGFEVVESALNRGWYTDDFLNTTFLDWMVKGESQLMMPWYVEVEHRSAFAKWTPVTRAAYVWQRLTNVGLRYGDADSEHCRHLRYEDLIDGPDAAVARIAQWLGLTATQVTTSHIAGIKAFPRRSATLSFADIEEPVRTAFAATMQRLAYG